MRAIRSRIQIGVIGCGHWGPNHVRVFSELDRCRVTACADLHEGRLQRIRQRHPGIRTFTEYQEILGDASIDAVVIATPTGTHARLVREALTAGKHVLVEKPLCVKRADAADLPALAAARGLHVMVGHVFLYNNGIMKLREAVVSGLLGGVHYVDAVRTNLGPIRGDVNALHDLGTHDISIFNYLLGTAPTGVSALGRCIAQPLIEDVCFTTLRYPDGTLGHIHVSWMNPRKVRTLTVIGERKMAHWDDVDPVDTLRIYDKGIEEPPHYNSFGEFQCLLRSADVHMPKIDRTEPLVNQANAFLDTLLNDAPCRSGLPEAMAVVAVLEAAQQSLSHAGALTPIDLPHKSTAQAATLSPAVSKPLRAVPAPRVRADSRRKINVVTDGA